MEEKTVDLGNTKLVPTGKTVRLLFYGTNEDDSLHMLIGLAKVQTSDNSNFSEDYDSEVDIDIS